MSVIYENHVLFNLNGDARISFYGNLLYINPSVRLSSDGHDAIVPKDLLKSMVDSPEILVDIDEGSSWSYREDSRGIDIHENIKKYPGIKVISYETKYEIFTVFVFAKKFFFNSKECAYRTLTVKEYKK